MEKEEMIARAICIALGENPDDQVVIYDPPIAGDDQDFDAKARAVKPIPAWRSPKHLRAADAAMAAMSRYEIWYA